MLSKLFECESNKNNNYYRSIQTATQLYLQSKLLDIEYFKAMTACAICGYINTALKVCHDKVNVQNVDTALNEFNSFCGRRINENFIDNEIARNSITLLYNELTHCLDVDKGDNTTRQLLGEIAPQCMERLLDNFLIKQSNLEKFDIDTLLEDIEKGNILHSYQE